MKNSIKSLSLMIIVFALALSSCNLPTSNQSPLIPQTGGTEASPESVPYMPEPTNTPEVMLPINTAEPVPTETAAPIVHLTVPVDSTYFANQIATDCNTGGRMAAGSNQVIISGCDYWNRQMIERPADSATGVYVPALDILWSQAGKSEPWIYLQMRLTNLAGTPAGFKAGFELDPDLDSRGEVLLMSTLPPSTAWTTDGVEVWQDVNQDNGGTKPFSYDQNTNDGYETNLFESGMGSDPDMAWARISPNNANTIEFAFKANILSNQNVFGWWAWTTLAPLTPGQFEPVDRVDEATTWNVDNSCSWIFGTTPTSGQLVNLCAVAPEPTATPTIKPGVPGTCVVEPCRLGFYFNTDTCSCQPFIIIIFPTPTPIIIF